MESQKRITVRDVMKIKFDRVDGRDTVQAALQKMEHQETHVLIVNKRNEEDEYGIVLLADIAKKVMAKDRSPNRVNIYEIMSKPVICVRAGMDIRYCARLFDSFGLNIAPVSENGKLVGTVSYNDIVLKGLVKLQD
ncbi:MAG TPA: CBS domain-containing protein [Chromatiales bacterium]|nr:CBS domain-containing protein [Thiotrichales bacterium]HIP69350.1 CBS domain-containing protein [Chromatiales bacterium]